MCPLSLPLNSLSYITRGKHMFTVSVSCMRVKNTVSPFLPTEGPCYITKEAHVYRFCFLHESKEDSVPIHSHWNHSYITREAHDYSFRSLHESKEDCVHLPWHWSPLLHQEGSACLQFLFPSWEKEDCVTLPSHWRHSATSWGNGKFTVSVSCMRIKRLCPPPIVLSCFITRETQVYIFYFLHESKEDCVTVPSHWRHSATSGGKRIYKVSLFCMRVKETVSPFTSIKDPLLNHKGSSCFQFLFHAWE
jgi:hypothetical protein